MVETIVIPVIIPQAAVAISEIAIILTQFDLFILFTPSFSSKTSIASQRSHSKFRNQLNKVFANILSLTALWLRFDQANLRYFY